MLLVAGHVECSDVELTANDGEKVDMTCSLQYGGSVDAGWRVEWLRSDSEQVLASFVDDSGNSVKRSYLLVAKYKLSDGDYSCLVTSRRPAYNDNCTTHLSVMRKSALVTADFIIIYCTGDWNCLKRIELIIAILIFRPSK